MSKIHALRENTYIEYITALQEDISSLGSTFAPVLSHNGRAECFKSYTKIENRMVSLGKAAVNVNATRFYLVDIQQKKGQTVVLEDDTTLIIPSTANVYVYDVRLELEKRLSKDGSLENVLVTYDSWNGSTYEDRLGEISDYVLFAREYQGRIMDVILYINVPLDA